MVVAVVKTLTVFWPNIGCPASVLCVAVPPKHCIFRYKLLISLAFKRK